MQDIISAPEFATFLSGVLAIRLDYFARNGYTYATPIIEVHPGQKFIKIVTAEIHKAQDFPSGHSCSAFIATEDFSNRTLGNVKKGDVFKSAGQTPAKRARGNIFDENNALEGYTFHGPAYLR